MAAWCGHDLSCRKQYFLTTFHAEEHTVSNQNKCIILRIHSYPTSLIETVSFRNVSCSCHWTWPVLCLAMVRTPNAWRAPLCWWAWPWLVQSQIHGAQILHYHFHSSQALWPTNLDTVLQEPPQRFLGFAHGPRNTLWLMGLYSLVWRALLPPPAVSRCQWLWFSAFLCHSPSTENLTPPIFLKWRNATYWETRGNLGACVAVW